MGLDGGEAGRKERLNNYVLNGVAYGIILKNTGPLQTHKPYKCHVLLRQVMF